MDGDSNAKKTTRRDFLRFFVGGTANTVNEVLVAALPNPTLGASDRQRVRSANVAAVQRALIDAAPDDPLIHCARCYAEFAPTSDETLCPDCRALDAQRHSVFAELFHPHG
jgi:hypothetical protein